MSEGIGHIIGSVGNFAGSDGLDSIVDQLSQLIGRRDTEVTIDMESGSSCESSPAASEIFKRIDTLR